jgi:hypothetical protein
LIGLSLAAGVADSSDTYKSPRLFHVLDSLV